MVEAIGILAGVILVLGIVAINAIHRYKIQELEAKIIMKKLEG